MVKGMEINSIPPSPHTAYVFQLFCFQENKSIAYYQSENIKDLQLSWGMSCSHGRETSWLWSSSNAE